jgi:DNA-binding response OmpR family regulator
MLVRSALRATVSLRPLITEVRSVRVLLVEDDAGIAAFVRQGLSEAGFTVDAATDGPEGLAAARVATYDAIILDGMLPGLDGLNVLAELRRLGIRTPVLLLTARTTVDDRVAGLEQGADDYLTKPFAFAELLARMRALMRRPPLQADQVLRVGDLELDPLRRIVRRGGAPIDLSPREFALLTYLMRHAGQALTRTQIAEQIWSLDYAGDSNIVDVYIGYLRRKLALGQGGPQIQTVRGVGYRLSLEPDDA